MKSPLTLAGIEPATFRFVAKRLNHCATAVPYIYIYICNEFYRDCKVLVMSSLPEAVFHINIQYDGVQPHIEHLTFVDHNQEEHVMGHSLMIQ